MAKTHVADALGEAWRARGWPDDLLQRALGQRVRPSRVKRWAANQRWTVDRVEQALERSTRLAVGSMRLREATWEDSEALADLYANSPERVGDSEVTVERSPFPFAQFRLQENATIQVLEDRGVLLAALAHSARSSVVEGRQVTVHIPSGWRVRKECRGEGLGPLVQRAQPSVAPGVGTYYYRRRGGKKHRTWATVHCFPSRPYAGEARGIRLARRADVPSCVDLINRTHGGLDLFRPAKPVAPPQVRVVAPAPPASSPTEAPSPQSVPEPAAEEQTQRARETKTEPRTPPLLDAPPDPTRVDVTSTPSKKPSQADLVVGAGDTDPIRLQIERALRDKGLLKEPGSKALGVTVKIRSGGIVTLTGVVRDHTQRLETVRTARAVPGVAEVREEINVQGSWGQSN